METLSCGGCFCCGWPTALISNINSYWTSPDPDPVTALTEKNAYRSLFWGKDFATPGPGGNGACRMAMSTAEALGNVLSGAGTMCYMKGIQNVSGGVTVSSGSISSIFAQGSADKKVRVNVSGYTPGRSGGSFNVNFTIKGTDSVGSNSYAYDVHFCKNPGSGWMVNGTESATVDKSSGLVTMTSNHREDADNYGTNTVTAYLKNEDGNVSYDLSKERVAISYGNHSGGTAYRGKVVITGDNVITNYRGFTGAGVSNKDFSMASFSGSSMSELRFLEGAYKGLGVWGANSFNYDGATEYQTVASGSYPGTYYVAVDPNSSTIGQTSSFQGADVSTDAFLAGTNPAAPSYDTAALCDNWNPDVTVTMDFLNADIIALKNTCDNGNYWRQINHYLCQGQKLVETSPGSGIYERQDITELKDAFDNVKSWSR